MKRAVLLAVPVMIVLVVVLGTVRVLLNRSAAPSPTLTVVSSAVPSEFPTASPTVTLTPTETPTATLTASPTATMTNTLATLVLQITAINPDVTLDARPSLLPVQTSTSLPTVVVPSPGATLRDVPTGESTPGVGWFRYGVDHPALQKNGQWAVFTSTYRSANHRYLFTDAQGARLSLRFLGDAARVRYVRLSSYGVFEVRIDGRVVTTVDAYLPKSVANGDFVTTDVFGLVHGWHTLGIVRLDRRNPDSTGGFIAIDGIDVYQNGAAAAALPIGTAVAPTLTASPAPLSKIEVVAAPPTTQPTLTLAPPQLIAVSLTVAYDLNGNKAVEPGEGVADLPVQLVTADTNRVVASGSTNAQGYVRLETTGTAPLRLVIPYFNRFWDVPPRASGTQITLLIPPANRPALIP